MALTPEKYQKLQALLSDPEKDLSEDFRARAQAAVDAYRNDYREAAQSPLSAEMPEQYDPSKTQQVASGIRQASDEGAHALLAQLDPSYSLPAQALAVQPATTHPEGDEAAKEEWLRGDINNPNFVVFFEPPVAVVRKKLLENPELFRALQLPVDPTPEGVMSIEEGDSTHQLYADYAWRQAAEAASKGGKTAYRRAKAPWLGDGKNASRLETLRTKLGTDSGDEGQAFVLGFDDTASFGIGRAVQDAEVGPSGASAPSWLPQDSGRTALTARPYEKAGGIPEDASAQERNDMLEESNPAAHALGQVAGFAPGLVAGVAKGAVNLGKSAVRALRGEAAPAAAAVASKGPHWTLSDLLWDYITTSNGTPQTALRGAAAGLARTGAAGAADQAIREGAQAASSYAQTGEAGATLEEAGGRVLGATAASVLPGLVGGGLRGLSNQVSEGVKWGERYGGAPGRVEAHGVETRLGRGHVAPEVVKQAELRGRQEGGRSALTVLASDLDEPLGDAARGRVAKAEQLRADTVAAHRASPEAGYTLPSGGLVRAAIDELHELTSDIPKKGPRGVGKPRIENPVRDVLNANIEGASWRAGKHSVPISVEGARAWLNDEWLRKLKLGNKPSVAANDNGGLQRQGGKLFPWAAVDPDELVWLTPRRYDSQHFDEVIEQLGKSNDPHMQKLHAVAREGRAARGTGEYAAALNKRDADLDAAKSEAERVGANRPRGVRKKVEAVGKSKGQHEATPALRAAAREAGGDAPEKLRGALVAEDLQDLRNWSTLGGRNPLASPWSLWGMTDKAILKGAYPAARMVQRLPTGGAAQTARVTGAAARGAMDDRAEDRRKERDEKSAEGYRERAKEAGAGKRRRTRRKVRPRTRRSETSEAER